MFLVLSGVFHVLYHGLKKKIFIEKNIVVFMSCMSIGCSIHKKGFDRFLGPFYHLKLSWKKWAKLGGGGRS